MKFIVHISYSCFITLSEPIISRIHTYTNLYLQEWSSSPSTRPLYLDPQLLPSDLRSTVLYQTRKSQEFLWNAGAHVPLSLTWGTEIPYPIQTLKRAENRDLLLDFNIPISWMETVLCFHLFHNHKGSSSRFPSLRQPGSHFFIPMSQGARHSHRLTSAAPPRYDSQ